MKCFRKSISLSVTLALCGLAWSHQALALNLNDAVQSSISHNPEVLAKLDQYKGAGEDINVGRADYMPTVDLGYEANRQKFTYPTSTGSPVPADQTYTTKGWTLSLTQNLFRGLQTYNQVKELGYDQQASYFNFLDESESMALQTTQAYQDVLRYRHLVELAKDNYGIHEGIFNQIMKQVQAGVGRKVDLEQAAGRLALAETNLITDNSNLHDVSVRYARLTGSMPPDQMDDLPSFTAALPDNDDLIKNAVANSPAYLSAVASVKSARAEVNVRRGAFSPTLDLQASDAPNTTNYDGYLGKTKETSVAIIFNMNLFRGGADRARLGSAAAKLNTTLDQRDKVCRDMRQTLSIANNNVIKLKEQMDSLLQHELSTEKARDAYRKQFDIGQRTLLDVLDSENELFDAQRAYVNAQADYNIAEATVLGNSGRLLETLQLKPIEDLQMAQPKSDEDSTACDASYTAPETLDVTAIPPREFGQDATGN